MKQIWVSKAGPPEVLKIQETADPSPVSGEVRIRVEACGVNFADILGRMGIYYGAPNIPYVPGLEVAGVIDLVGQGVPGFREGDKVLAATRFRGYSNTVCVPHKQVMKRWDWMTPEDAAGLPVNYLTAYMLLIVMGSLHSGDKVLIHNAGGGVGIALLDICKIVGAETYGTASPQKHKFLMERGLHHPIDYRNRDYEQVLLDLTAKHGVHIILDPMGGKNWIKNYRLLMPTGRLIHYGYSSVVTKKSRSLLELLKLVSRVPFYSPIKLMKDNKAVMGVNLGNLWEYTEIQRTWMKQIMQWYDEALFRPQIDKTFTFEEAAKAHHYMQDRKNIGKILLIP